MELILPPQLTSQTEKLIRHYTRTKHKDETVRVERLSKDKFDVEKCLALCQELIDSSLNSCSEERPLSCGTLLSLLHTKHTCLREDVE